MLLLYVSSLQSSIQQKLFWGSLFLEATSLPISIKFELGSVPFTNYIAIIYWLQCLYNANSLLVTNQRAERLFWSKITLFLIMRMQARGKLSICAETNRSAGSQVILSSVFLSIFLETRLLRILVNKLTWWSLVRKNKKAEYDLNFRG